MPQEIWLIRHGETEWSKSGAHTGRTDIPLTETGRQRATKLGDFLKGRHFDLVLTSPLSRARETCRLAGLGELAHIDENLREWDYGSYEGRTTADIRKECPGWDLWRDGVVDGETVDDVGKRAKAVIERVNMPSGKVALFAHGHILRILGSVWIALPPQDGRSFALDTASVSVLGYERENRVHLRWNLTPAE